MKPGCTVVAVVLLACAGCTDISGSVDSASPPSSTPDTGSIPAPNVVSAEVGASFFCGSFGDEQPAFLLAIDLDTATPLWHMCPGDVVSARLYARAVGATILLEQDGRGSMEAVAIDDSGIERWRRPAREDRQVLFVSGSTVVVVGTEVEAIDAASGDVRWSHPLAEGMPIGTAGDLVIETQTAGITTMRALRADSGEEKWTREVAIPASPAPYRPMVTTTAIVIPNLNGTTTFIDAASNADLDPVDGLGIALESVVMISDPSTMDLIAILEPSSGRRLDDPGGQPVFTTSFFAPPLPTDTVLLQSWQASGPAAELWMVDLATGNRLWEVPYQQVIGRSAEHIVTVDGPVLQVLDARDLSPVMAYQAPTDLATFSAAVEGDGILIVTAGWRGLPAGSPTGDTTPTGGASPATTAPSTDEQDPSGSIAPTCPNGEYPAVGAVDLASGEIEWSICSPQEAYRTIIGAAAEVVLVYEHIDATNGQIVALDPVDGAERWRRSTPPRLGMIPRGPVASGGVVVFVTDDGGPIAAVGVDVLTGQDRWRVDETEVLGLSADVVVLSDATTGPGSPPSGVRGIDRSTGEERWSSDVVFLDTGGSGVSRGAAAVWENVIAVPTGSTLTGLDMATGAELWTVSPLIEHPEAADGVVVGGQPPDGPDASLAAVDATTGEQLWTAPGKLSYGGLLAVGDGVVVALDADWQEILAYELESGDIRWSVARASGAEPQLIVGTSAIMLWEGELAVLSTADGSTTWAATQPFRSELMNSVGSNGTTVFVAINSLPFGD